MVVGSEGFLDHLSHFQLFKFAERILVYFCFCIFLIFASCSLPPFFSISLLSFSLSVSLPLSLCVYAPDLQWSPEKDQKRARQRRKDRRFVTVRDGEKRKSGKLSCLANLELSIRDLMKSEELPLHFFFKKKGVF